MRIYTLLPDDIRIRRLFAIAIIWFLAWHDNALLAERANEPIIALPLDIRLDKDLVALGETLFYDPRLSRDSTQSCASCHDLSLGGIDKYDSSAPSNNKFNAPTVFNVGFSSIFFWNGRASSLEEQIELTIYSPSVFNNDWSTILEKLNADTKYKTFLAEFLQGKKLDSSVLKKALAEFERSLWTPNSRFDRFLRGDATAISKEEEKGFEIFKNLGCSSCHQGMLLGGNMFQKFGIFGIRPFARQDSLARDLGRYTISKREKDKYLFKVPSLRNVELTAPYFHNGAAKTLEEAVLIMGQAQLGRNLSPEEMILIVKFLRTLTGELRGSPLK